MGSCFPPDGHSPRQHPAQACPEGTFFDRPNRPWPQTSRSVSPRHTLRRMNLPSPSHAATPLTARHAVDPRHVHEQTDKPVPRPNHVLKGHSSLAQGSPRSGYPGDRSPPSASALKGLASTGHHPAPPRLSPIPDRPPRATPTPHRPHHPDRGDRNDPGGRALRPPPVTSPVNRQHPEGGAKKRG